ncbi:MAG: ROK family protein [Rikenellaceae bacterium]
MKKIAIGIDIGGTNSVFGAVDAEGTIFAEGSIRTSDYPSFDHYPQYIEAMCSGIRSLISGLGFNYELVGIGIGAPNAAFHRGVIEKPTNLWKFPQGMAGGEEMRVFPIVEDMKRNFPECEDVVVTNDANAATIGEMMFGAARGMKDFVVVTLGTGLGSGFVAGGEMIYGRDGMAGELGHMNVVRGGRECGCGLRGCLECYVSATGITRTAVELMCEMRDPSPLRELPVEKIESLTIAKAAAAGDAISKEAFRRTAEVLGQALADTIAITTPEAIILFGGLAKAGDILFKPTFEYMEANTIPVLRGKTKLLASGVQDGNIAILGSAALIWQRLSVE